MIKILYQVDNLILSTKEGTKCVNKKRDTICNGWIYKKGILFTYNIYKVSSKRSNKFGLLTFVYIHSTLIIESN